MKPAKTQKLPFHPNLAIEALKENLTAVIAPFAIAIMALGFSALIYFSGKPEWNTYVLSGVFLLVFIGLVILSVFLTYSSSMYSYEKKLLNELGRPAFAYISLKEVHTTNFKTGKNNDKVETVHDYYLEYKYNYQGHDFESAQYINSKKLYDQIQLEDEVPILVLHDTPNISRIRTVTLRNKLKQS